jgi:hypothetical protein
MGVFHRAAVLAWAFALAAACSSPETTHPPVIDFGGGNHSGLGGGIPEAGIAEAGASGDAGLCNNVPEIGYRVTQMNVPSAPPAATGGTIVDGTYILTSFSIFTGQGGSSAPTGHWEQQEIVLSGNGPVMQSANLTDSYPTWLHENFSFAPAGTNINVAQTCPTAGPPTAYPYSASPTFLQIFVQSNALTTYGKQ